MKLFTFFRNQNVTYLKVLGLGVEYMPKRFYAFGMLRVFVAGRLARMWSWK